jgi:Fic family protein
MKPYEPQTLPLDLNYSSLVGLVGRANAALARYDGLLQGIVNPQVLLSPLTTQEAVLSSKIEGTQATLDEVLQHEAGALQEGEKATDIKEIQNYRLALRLSTDCLADRPLSLGLVRQMHTLLMDSVRGQDKEPGQFRKEQNWIGRPGCKLEEASFVPPSPLRLLDHLENWERYLGLRDVDPLIQTAVVHAQFEVIHPFKDGNGRIGRVLIPLFLYQQRALATPMFYLSEYLEANRERYYDRLRGISAQEDWLGWIAFFLEAVEKRAETHSLKVREMLALYNDMKLKITEATRSKFAIAVLDAIFDRPIFPASGFGERLGINKVTATTLLKQLRDAGVLMPLREASGRRAALLAFPALLNIAEGRAFLPKV